MRIDVVKYRCQSVVSLHCVNGYINFRDLYSHWFREPGEMYIRYVGKENIGKWRFVPNKSTDFYRLPFVNDQSFINKLNKDFEINRIY